MLKGEVVLGGIMVLIYALSKSMSAYSEYLKSIRDLTLRDVGFGSAIAGAMIVGVGAICGGIGALMTTGPVALAVGVGAAFVLGLSAVIFAISKAMISFSTMIKSINDNLSV